MIPAKLTLKNFMCYRDNVPALSFEGIHIACLCGDNGNGKSALFDAITWALWGKSRAKSDDDLIHMGQAEMEVEFEFDLQGQRYRVVRKRSKKPGASRAGQSALELQISSDGTYKAISGNTIIETQQKIIDLIKLDYDTFINSAFIRQGHSDEFSIKRPGERKEVISNILGLSIYEEFEKKAKDTANRLAAEADGYQYSIDDIIKQLSNKDEFLAEAANLSESLKLVEQQKQEQDSKLTILRLQKESLELKKEQQSNAQRRLKEIQTDLNQWQQKVTQCQKDISEYEKVLIRKDEIVQGYLAYVEAKKSDDDFNKKLGLLVGLREQKNKLEKRIIEANSKLTNAFERIQDGIRQKQEKINKTPRLEEELVQARANIKLLAEKETGIAEKRKQSTDLVSEVSYMRSVLGQIDVDIKNLQEKTNMLDGDDVHCPLCDTELGVEGRHRIQEKYAVELNTKLQAQKDINSNLITKKAELQKLEKEMVQQEAVLAGERIKKLNAVTIFEKELGDILQAKNELSEEKNKLVEIETMLLKRNYAIAEQQALMEMESQERDLQYDSERHEQVKAQVSQVQQYGQLKQELDFIEKDMERQKVIQEEACQSVERLDQTSKQILEQVETIDRETASMKNVASELDNAEGSYKLILRQERDSRDKLIQVEERSRRLTELENTREQKEKQLHKVKHDEGIYKELADAFSKKGVQSLLIQQAFPEIEIEANRLLGKMTDNRLSLALESQKESKTKKNESIDTLDIKIADELGTRNYEMFSGGEAFRIDLALRIALSKLLVRRVGASLPILIIDEGFGTQDSSGREKLVEAINSIQDDFDKIFVITHLEELKDYFPVQIRVTKNASGSMIAIE